MPTFKMGPFRAALPRSMPTNPSLAQDSHSQARRLTAQLQELNGQEVTPRRRLDGLEPLTQIALSLLPVLNRQIVGLSFPLTPRNTRLADELVAFQLALYTGYSLCIESEMQKPDSLLQARVPVWLLAGQRMLYYFGELVRTHLLLNRDLPVGLWRLVHQLYHHSQRRELLRLGLPHEGEQGDQPGTLDQAYKRVLLRALMRPERLLPNQQQEACRAFDEWVDLVELAENWEAHEGTHYYVDLESDAAPYALPNHTPARAMQGRERLVDLEPLGTHLRGYIAVCREGGVRALTRNNASVSLGTLQRLYRAWCQPRFRGAERKHAEGQIPFTIGLESALAHWGVLPAYVRAPNTSRLWSAQVKDRSNTGLRLGCRLDPEMHLTVGELVVLQESRVGMHTVGEVRWLRAQPEELQFGIQRQLNRTFPVSLERISEEGDARPPMAAMAGVDSAGKPILLIPRDPTILYDTLTLRFGERLTPIRLRRRLSALHTYEIFHFYRLLNGQYHKESGLNSSQLLTALS